MTAIARAVAATSAKDAFIRLGGTGSPYVTPHGRDVVYADIPAVGEIRVGNVTVSAEKAMSYIPFFAAVRNISEDIASLPLNVYRVLDGGGREVDRSHPVQVLMHEQPNPYMSAFAFRETLQSHVLTWGNGYAEIEFATDGSVLALWPLRPDRTTVFIDRETDQVVYRYRLSSGGDWVDLPRRKVFHVHGLGYDGLVGYSIIERARHMLGMAVATQKDWTERYEKGGIPPAYLSHPTELSDTARGNLRKSIDDGTLSDRNRMALLEEGMDIKTVGIPPKDMMFIESGSMTRSLTSTLFRMAPHMLQDIERSTSWGSGVESQKIEYTTFTLRSWLVRWEQEGKISLLRGEDRYLRHVIDGLLRGDTRTRWAAYTAGMDRGVYSIDDVLEMEDRNPLPNDMGKRHFVQLNTAPLDQVGEMSMEDRIAALGGLVRAGFTPQASTDALDLPNIDHTGLEPVTVQELVPTNGNGNGAQPR